jgi:hypothetical protein
MNLYSKRLKNNFARIARVRAKVAGIRVVFSRASPAAVPADMHITPRGCGNEALADSSSIMSTTAAPALTANGAGDFPLVHATFYAPGSPIGAWGGIRFKF